MIRKVVLIALLLLGSKSMAQVSIDDCLKWARENYPEVKRYDIIKATEDCNLSNASKNWLPMVSIGVQGGWINNTADINDITCNLKEDKQTVKDRMQTLMDALGATPLPHWQYRAGVEVVQPIYDGGATSLQRELARKEAEADRAKIEVSLHTLEEKVLDVYFAILLLENRKEQATLNNDLLSKNLTKLRNLEKEGLAMLIDVEAVEVEQLKLEQAIGTIDENLNAYRKTLSLLTGHNIVSDELIRPSMPTVERPAFSSLAEMQLLDKQKELLNLKNRHEKVKAMPKLGLMGQAYYGFPGNNIFRDIVNHDPQLNVAVGLKLSWDIMSLYKRKNNLSNISMELQTIENHRELLLFRQRLANSSLEEHVKRHESIIQKDDRIVELRQKLRKAEEAKVDNDIVDATELLSKIKDEAEARLQRSVHEIEIIHDAYKLMHNGDTER